MDKLITDLLAVDERTAPADLVALCRKAAGELQQLRTAPLGAEALHGGQFAGPIGLMAQCEAKGHPGT